MLLENTIHLGDCLELMKQIPDASVDLILCDLPYGTTACAWDSVIPLESLWTAYSRILKADGVVALTASQPFTTSLISSNRAEFRYEWIWEKDQGSNFLMAKKQPLKTHESVLIFSRLSPRYFPQMREGKPRLTSGGTSGDISGNVPKTITANLGTRYPRSVFYFVRDRGLHPTQKPVALFEYLIKTYTNPGELVLDNCAGSGTTAVACKQTGRRYLCIEKDRDYWLKACERVNQSSGFHDVASMATQAVIEPKTEPPLA